MLEGDRLVPGSSADNGALPWSGPDAKSAGIRLGELRKTQGVTLADLAARLGIASYRNLSPIFSGTRPASAALLSRIAEAMGVTLTQHWTIRDRPKPRLFGSLFAGIGGFDLALLRKGWSSAWAAESDRKCNAVRRHHWPDERTFLDVHDVKSTAIRPDLITAGWPCQGNSVAGRRLGLADPRSGLWSEVVRVLSDLEPRWFFGENVPGILSVRGGRDWLAVLQDLAKLGYGFAYRIFDAQFFGVAQRRRRVFIVGCLGGDWRRAAEVLFERESLPWNSPASGKTEANVACTLESRTAGRGEPGSHIVSYAISAGAGGSKLGSGRLGQDTFVTHTLTAEGHDASEDGTGRGTPLVTQPPGDTDGHSQAAFAENQRGELREASVISSLSCAGGKPGMGYPAVRSFGRVRRLTPLECERLQGFPDEWTRYGDERELSDSARYRMVGNAVAVPVAEWIVNRINKWSSDR